MKLKSTYRFSESLKESVFALVVSAPIPSGEATMGVSTEPLELLLFEEQEITPNIEIINVNMKTYFMIISTLYPFSSYPFASYHAL